MKKTITSLLLIALCVSPTFGQPNFDISLARNTEKEIQTKNKLEALLKEYDVSKWTFTRKIVIDEQEFAAHSHPILTISGYRYINRDPADLLSVFVHEQIHWFTASHLEHTGKAKDELKIVYPDAPTAPPEGARDKESTYLHLIVCFLEYEAMKELVGKEKAKEVIERQSTRSYKWIYRTVLSDGDKIKAVIDRHKLQI
jgi:hypothetical protein